MKQKWYQKTIEQVLSEQNSSFEGLSQKEASLRLQSIGPNKLPDIKPESWLKILSKQFINPLVYILVFVGALMIYLGHCLDSVVIFLVVIFNALIGAIQEGKAQNTLLALKNFVRTQTLVKRDGVEVVVSDFEIVPGDIVVLRAGDKVPADGRVILNNSATLDQSSLTGESVPVSKSTEALGQNPELYEQILSPADQVNMVFKGTTLHTGSLHVVITETGVQTEIGQLSKEIAYHESEIPIQKNIRQLSRLILITVLLASALLFVVGWLQGQAPIDLLIMTISLAVSLIPEGLPVVMTLILANGVWRMSRRQALVRKLGAVEALGQTDIIAVDKTGTITRNELTVTKLWVNQKEFDISGVGYQSDGQILLNQQAVSPIEFPELHLAGKIAAFSDADIAYDPIKQKYQISGDPIDASLLIFSEKAGFNQQDIQSRHRILKVMEFDYVKKYRAVIFAEEVGYTLAVIGAPEVILEISNQTNGRAKEKLQEFSQLGLRVIAVAVAQIKDVESASFDNLPPLEFGGFWGLQDSMHREVPSAVMQTHKAGIRTVMITGDYPETAKAIAKSAGIYNQRYNRVITGEEIKAMSDKELMLSLDDVSVFARITPTDKMKIIQAFRKKDLVVAMTGDGINDVPPLVTADLGIAMGRSGTDVTKEAADIILLDDNFSTIVAAVEEGRNIYQTIKYALLYLFSTNIAEFLVIAVALFVGWPLPLTAVQILWLNFVTDGFITVSFAVEPKSHNLLTHNYKKPNRWLINREMVSRMIPMAVIMSAGTLLVYSIYLEYEPLKAGTMALTTLAAYQWFNAFNSRRMKSSAFARFFVNKWFLFAVGFVVIAQIIVIHTMIGRKFLGLHTLGFDDWMIVLAFSSLIIWFEEIRKLWYKISKKNK
ncbi:MAG: HAD-IC family P-type ATPase [Candidatus Doudnabacteria bacterium]